MSAFGTLETRVDSVVSAFAILGTQYFKMARKLE